MSWFVAIRFQDLSKIFRDSKILLEAKTVLNTYVISKQRCSKEYCRNYSQIKKKTWHKRKVILPIDAKNTSGRIVKQFQRLKNYWKHNKHILKIKKNKKFKLKRNKKFCRHNEKRRPREFNSDRILKEKRKQCVIYLRRLCDCMQKKEKMTKC